jgi:signal transduction histidine kinase
MRHKDGHWVDILSRANAVFDEQGKGVRFVGTHIDITARKRAERELQKYREQLEHMVEERTRDLKETQEKLLRQEKLAVLGQLAGSVAHELRHPLGILSNAAYFLNMSLPDAGETTSEYLEMMAVEIRRADKIIADLLGFSKNQTTTQDSKVDIPLSGLIAEALAEQPPPDGVKVLHEKVAEDPVVFVDGQQIRQVLTNLVLNAYQAMPEGGTLSIAIRSDDEHACVAIADTGGGIAPEHLDKLFEPLFTTKPKGIGLGLAISQKLADANGGSITAESREGEGTTFILALPTYHEEEQGASTAFRK